MKEMNIDQVLSHDSIAETEKTLGNKHYSEFNDFENAVMMMNFIQDNKKKEQILKTAKDTYFSISWNDFITLIKEHGFVEGLSYDFPYEDKTEQAIIYYHSTKGLVIWATSYFNKKDLNGGDCYGFVKHRRTDKSRFEDRGLLSGCSNGYIDWQNDEGTILHFKVDVREGLIHILNRIETGFKFMQKWPERQFLWFVDFIENKAPGYDYKEITENKISQCTKELQEIIG